ncbi:MULTISPECIES: GnsA/GnsB family addiction module toxin [Enterobacter]|jgi:translation elongation factor EF-1alpha|uniref:Addiction module toxin, GnsA/GnsB family n=1 Tax=Enterobacter bugandensis TaxID=881260 RepID=A0ABX4VQD2_9ENTR|nr:MULTISPECIES: addiction module toxin, GnsA/GnsB family [Enterobacter]ELK6539426.1 addiction module toxin, GnsA/GnsB family [Enterobacter bugandensis]MBZ6366488.1 addiction module toxin, GnsA/GnsB family [Enterobacter bugandensis]MCE1956365.1 addiction module toxin, GnsA/GnsB family [Enterobacter bugandensis]MCK6750912.1 addiction module toxin, GnsA/GnsB family [Enterobacter bugandensis]MCK6764191.1 addiction module toxin, GnsA/GnsB family [Enterobacter bugandensis]
MNSDNIKSEIEKEISSFISKKMVELRKKTGKEVSDVEFIPIETMSGLQGYSIKIKLI